MSRTAIAAAVAAAAFVPLASHAADYAAVISSTPVVQQFNSPQRVCTQDQVPVAARPSGAGALIGAVAGGLLGNALGSAGGARAAATGLGAVAGAAIGHGVESNVAANTPAGSMPVENCQVVSRLETRTVGYDVVYEYHGQRYTTRTASDPGDRIRIDGRQLAQAAPVDAPPPAYGPSTAQPGYGAPQPGYGVAQPGYGAPQGGYDAPQPGYAPAPTYGPQPVYSAPPTVYGPPAVVYAPAPAYYVPRPVYVAPAISFGFGYYGGYGYRGYRHGWH